MKRLYSLLFVSLGLLMGCGNSEWTERLNAVHALDVETESLERLSSTSLLVAHSGGGVDGKAYTNSLEALKLNYSAGHRIFELDLLILHDDKIVAGNHVDQMKEIAGLPELPIEGSSFLKSHIFGHLTPISARDVGVFLEEHKDAYIVTDSKRPESAYRSETWDDYNRAFWSTFVSILSSIDADSLNRVVPQLYYPEMLAIVDEYHAFDRYILTLYAQNWTLLEIQLLLNSEPRIVAVTMPYDYISDERLISLVRGLNREVFLHTVNSVEQMRLGFESGASGFYTNFISPSEIGDLIVSER